MATNEEVMILFKGKDDVSQVADNINHKVKGIGDSATGIRGKIRSVADSFDFVSSTITGVLGGMSLLDQATNMWNAATQRQTSEFYLGANIGTQKAKEMTKAIQDIVAQVPGDDTFMNMILSGSLAKQTDMSTSELNKQASVVADYLAGSEMQGKNAIEAQQDMKSYILSGSTAELERSSILSNQVDKLKDKATIQERINALAEAEAAEKVAGLSGYDTAANALTEFQGQIEKAYADLGSMFLPIEQSVIQGFLDINDSVGGSLSTVLVGAATGASALATGIGSIGATFTGLNSMIEFFSGLKTVLFGTQAAEEALTAATTVSTTATEAQASVTSLLATSQMEAGLAEAGLTEAEVANMAATYGVTSAIGYQEVATAALSASNMEAMASEAGLSEAALGAALAHAGNIPVLEAEGVAATTSSGGFWALAGSIWATVWPILAVIAAVGLIAVGFEQLGEWLGWWTDFGTMIDSIKSGVMRLWDAFKNSQAVQRTIIIVTLAFNALKTVAQPVLDWLGKAWNELFNGGGAGSGGPDAIGAIIQAFTVLDNIGTQVFNTMITWGTAVYGALLPIITIVSNIFNVLSQLWTGQVSLGQGFMMLLQNFGALHQQLFILIVNIFRNILTTIANAVVQIVPMIVTFLKGIPSAVGNALVTLVPMVVRFLLNALVQLILFRARMQAAAIRLGLAILNGILNFVKSIPTRVVSFIRQLPGRINSARGAVLSAARNLGKQAYDGVVNYVTQIPDKVGQEFHGIAGKVIAVGGELYNAAKDAAQKLWDGFNSILDQHSPGIFMRAIDYEFKGIPGIISNSFSAAYGAARTYATQMATGFQTPQITATTAAVIRDNANYTPKNTSGGNTYIAKFEKGAFDVDARNFTEQEAQGILITAFESINPEDNGGGAI